MLVIDGEAGIGKSRLGWEFEKYVDGLDATVLWHRGRCLSYGDGVAYYALAEAVRGRLTISPAPSTMTRMDAGRAAARPRACVHDASDRDWLDPRLPPCSGHESGTASFTRDDLFLAWTTFFKYVGLRQAQALPTRRAGHRRCPVRRRGAAGLPRAPALRRRLPGLRAGPRPTRAARRAPHLAGNRRVTVVHLEPLSAGEMARCSTTWSRAARTHRDQLVSRAEGVPLLRSRPSAR